jgi:hypothetical protein
MKPRSAKAKGTKAENDLKKDLIKAGVPHCRRQPLSGALDDFKGDVVIDARDWELKVEAKHHKTIPNYERLERHREQCDGCFVDTPGGRFYWMTHDAFLDLMSRAYGDKPPHLPCITLGMLKAGKTFKQYDTWIKGCDLLAVRPNFGDWRWWITEKLFWDICAHAAQGAFAPEPIEYDGPFDAAEEAAQ